MKLLLDENLSDRIIPKLLPFYPGSSHVKAHDLIQTDDAVIWQFAAHHGFTIVSKDGDFHQRSLVLGSPPKFVFLRVGNCSTNQITRLLIDHGHHTKPIRIGSQGQHPGPSLARS